MKRLHKRIYRCQKNTQKDVEDILIKYHHIPIRMAKGKNNDKTKCWQEYGRNASQIHCY